MFRNLKNPDATLARRLAITFLVDHVINKETLPYGDSNLGKCGVRGSLARS
jgi:hypothetical protein